MQPITFTASTEDAAQIEAIRAFMKALKIKFEVQKSEAPCDPAMEKVLESREQAKNGQVKQVAKKDLKAFSSRK